MEPFVAVTTFCKKAFCFAANSGSRSRDDLFEEATLEVVELKQRWVIFSGVDSRFSSVYLQKIRLQAAAVSAQPQQQQNWEAATGSDNSIISRSRFFFETQT
jgi:hypothetical protein